MQRARKQRVEAEATRLLAAGVTGQVFPGGTACVAWREDGVVTFAEARGGRLAPGAPAVEIDTPYDLASLTKPFVATAALRLHAAGKLDLSVRCDSLLPDVRGGTGGAANLEQLLTHRGGLAPWGGLYLDVPHEVGSTAARRWIVSEAARRPAENPKAICTYSDLGYIIAGEAIAREVGSPLDEVVRDWVTAPLRVDELVYYAGALPADKKNQLQKRAAPTERCEWRGKIVRGEVHDENASALGGVAGHAGLFGSARGVAMVGLAVLESLAGKSEFLPADVMEWALREREGGTYRFGWDGRSGTGSAAGRRMSQRAFGHLGFTGTSIWCDPDRGVAVVLLTNRVHPSRANEKIKGFRPAFHDGVLAGFDGN